DLPLLDAVVGLPLVLDLVLERERPLLDLGVVDLGRGGRPDERAAVQLRAVLRVLVAVDQQRELRRLLGRLTLGDLEAKLDLGLLEDLRFRHWSLLFLPRSLRRRWRRRPSRVTPRSPRCSRRQAPRPAPPRRRAPARRDRRTPPRRRRPRRRAWAAEA